MLTVLLEDTAALMKPQRIVQLPSTPSQSTPSGNIALAETSGHPHALPILVLSDLIVFFRRAGGDESLSGASIPNPALLEVRSGKFIPQTNQVTARGYLHVTRKLEFYIAHVLATPSEIMQGVAGEVLRWSSKVRAEGQIVTRQSSQERTSESWKKPQLLVEELG